MKALITGAGGQLGTDLVREFGSSSSYEPVAADHAHLDVGDRDAVLGTITTLRPAVVVHAGAWTAVDACEGDPDRAWRVNAMGSRNVAEGARLVGSYLLAVSTDYVFDGTLERPYTEWDEPSPRSVYGRSKLAGEREVLQGAPGSAVVRTAWVCGPHGANMLKTVLRLSAAGGELRFVDDQRGCPTFTADLARAIVQLAIGRRPGLFHVTNQNPTTWYGFARDVVAAAGRDPAVVRPIRTAELDPPRPAPRPANSVLDNTAMRAAGLPLLPDWHVPLAAALSVLGVPQ